LNIYICIISSCFIIKINSSGCVLSYVVEAHVPCSGICVTCICCKIISKGSAAKISISALYAKLALLAFRALCTLSALITLSALRTLSALITSCSLLAFLTFLTLVSL
tara:strand:- start:247 stop:570 length:324 start_codon:yes stop_codon:yes gene_type:complete